MPELCYFYGIHIRINFNDHNPPHFHAYYSEYEAQVRIDNGEVENGYLPKRAYKLVDRWLALHREEVWAAWEASRNHGTPAKIDPLP